MDTGSQVPASLWKPVLLEESNVHLLTHVLAQAFFCKHTFTNKYWAFCLEQNYTKINSLSLAPQSQLHNSQASPHKIPIGACMTWLLKAYFTLCWLTSLHFLFMFTHIHPFFYFLFRLLHQTVLLAPSFPFHHKTVRIVPHEWTKKNRSVLSAVLSDCCATSAH